LFEGRDMVYISLLTSGKIYILTQVLQKSTNQTKTFRRIMMTIRNIDATRGVYGLIRLDLNKTKTGILDWVR
jgi:hypothetical protein